ncbi:MAG: hypothetical protein PVH37_06825 [Desulfobacterales bacterium]
MKSSKNLKYIFRINHKCKPRNGVSEDKTNRLPVITEIDISRQSRALSWLRLTDYTLVVICGFMVAFALSELVVSFLSDNTVLPVIYLIMLPILSFAAYTGWQHAGEIDPAVWRLHSILFPVLAVFCLILGVFILVESDLFADHTNFGEDEIAGFLIICYVGSVAMLGWISLLLLLRTNITAMDTTVDRILLQLFKKAGVAAKKTTGIKPINKPRGLVIGTVGLLILAALIIAPKLGNEDLALASPIFQKSSSCWASSCFCGRDDISRSMPTLCLPSTSGHQFYSCGLLMTTKNRNSGGQTRHCWISLWKPGWPTTFPGSALSSLLVRQRKRSPS